VKISHEWNFGADPELADRLKELVLSGKKTASTGLCREVAKVPKIGEFAAVLGSDRKSVCVVRYTNVEIKPFLEVTYDFIQKEGEGDQNVEEWREKHRKFFGLTDDDVKVICEEFELAPQ
jgi:uncharacterized protein YhfF